ncbi:DedA family protein [Alteromonas aestuariivivens]|uniref:TVP38/TMEM64 family membrane protein n=1 Tax=Alteromonas aestuariivivens TaxID=1938339 RepID=A0A3D8MA78_9ALTE|nr:VTT domain-containing protein [Alteromonas aestuariivivens]RDV26764.1 DedA family protein [Alteromonas aestuariivivens]
MSWLKKFSVVAFLALAWMLTQSWPVLEHLTDSTWLSQYAKSAGGWTILASVGAMTVLLCIGLPRQVVGFVCGLWMGTAMGMALATFVSGLACALTYALARFWLSDWIAHRYSRRAESWQRWLTTDTFFKVLVIRLLPVGSNLVTNLLAGSLRVPPVAFVTASVIGYVPQTLIFALAGQGIAISSGGHLVASLVLFALATAVGIFLARRRHDVTEQVSDAKV